MPPCLVLTRPQAASESFARQARAAGWRGDVLIAPLMQIRLSPPPPVLLNEARVLIFTSQHGVASFAEATSSRHWPVWAVGPRTAEAAGRAGFELIAQASGGDAASLLAELDAAQIAGPFLHLHGRYLASDIAAALRARGHDARGCEVYAQEALALSDAARARLLQGGDLVLTAFSPRSAQLLAEQIAALVLDRAKLHMVAISQAAAEGLAALPLIHRQIASQPDAAGMLAALSHIQAALEPFEKPS